MLRSFVGVFNAKLIHPTSDEEETLFGIHYLNGSADQFNRTSTATLDNRQRFLNFIIETKLKIGNTKLENRAKLCTHKSPQMVRGESDWCFHTFDQIDYRLVNDRCNNGCKNAESDPDHYPVWAEFDVKLKIPEKATEAMKYNLAMGPNVKGSFN